ncbi:hypothetical protein LINPERPRIM_LOCUS30639, partial [Linum perenne]
CFSSSSPTKYLLPVSSSTDSALLLTPPTTSFFTDSPSSSPKSSLSPTPPLSQSTKLSSHKDPHQTSKLLSCLSLLNFLHNHHGSVQGHLARPRISLPLHPIHQSRRCFLFSKLGFFNQRISSSSSSRSPKRYHFSGGVSSGVVLV